MNGIRSAASKGAFEWIDSQSPDVLCVQELKAQDTFFAGVISQAWMGGLFASTVVFHWFTQLLTMVLPLGRRVAN